MRRKSITGPLLLIVFGTLFLLRSFFPELHLLHNTWPILLIVIGLVQLIARMSGVGGSGRCLWK